MTQYHPKHQVCSDVDKSIAHTLQSILNRLDKDCDMLMEKIDETLQIDSDHGRHNMKAHSWVRIEFHILRQQNLSSIKNIHVLAVS